MLPESPAKEAPIPDSASAVYSPAYREAQSILKASAPAARSQHSKPKVNQRSRSPSSCKVPSPASLVSVRVALHRGRTQPKCQNILRTDSQFIRWGEAECDLGPTFIRTIPEERRCLGYHSAGICELHSASFALQKKDGACFDTLGLQESWERTQQLKHYRVWVNAASFRYRRKLQMHLRFRTALLETACEIQGSERTIGKVSCEHGCRIGVESREPVGDKLRRILKADLPRVFWELARHKRRPVQTKERGFHFRLAATFFHPPLELRDHVLLRLRRECWPAPF